MGVEPASRWPVRAGGAMGVNKVAQKSKEAKMQAAIASGRSQKKKWSRNNIKEKLITPAVVSERLKVNVSVARQAIRHLEEKDLIEHVCEKHHAQMIYTRKIGGGD